MMDYASDKIRNYVSCGKCRLVFVPNKFHLSASDEKEIYDQHQNNPDDSGYRVFLSRLLTPLVERLEPNRTGLDFGSGPGPTLSVMLSEKGHEMDIYDPFYAPTRPVLTARMTSLQRQRLSNISLRLARSSSVCGLYCDQVAG